MPPAPAGFIFDLDGTLVDNMRFHMQAFEEFCDRHGLPPFTLEVRAKLDGKRNRDIFPVLFGRDLPDADLDRYAEEKETLYRALSKGRLRPLDGFDRLRALAEALNVPIGIATSSPEANIRHTLAEIGLAQLMPVVAQSDRLPRGKPFPDVFLEAARLIGADPRECIAFEDAPAGITAAASAGMRCVAVTTSFSTAMFAEHTRAPHVAVADFNAYLDGPGAWLATAAPRSAPQPAR